LVWHFDGATEPGFGEKPKLADPGPRPPSYPSFAATNTAKLFDGSGVTIREADVPKTALRFHTGETITLDAWVRVKQIKDGDYVYLIGKGRTKSKDFPEKNQNYALRLQAKGGEVRATFLFASAPEKDKPSDWHRWTSESGFALDDRWHHVAVSYTFGKPESIRSIVDGKARTGSWDMGGATTRAPVVDGDALQLGTGNGGGLTNSFRGWLDEVRIFRGPVPETALTAAYQFIPPPPAIRKADLVPGRVLVQLCEEGLPATNAWPDTPPPPTESYREDAFGFFEVPHKYIDTGIRGDRPNPFLFRASAQVKLPAGEHRLLLRARGASRLYVDGKLLLSTPFPPQDSSGHNPVIPAEKYLNLGPDFRFAPPGNRESWIAFKSSGGEHVVMLETLVGGFVGKAKKRPELGETVVAISYAGSNSWELLAPGSRRVNYTDEGWASYRAERSEFLDKLNNAARLAQRNMHAEYWNRRRTAAREWLNSTPEVAVPTLPKGAAASNAIDHFLAATRDRVLQQTAGAKRGTIDYFSQVQPILENQCYGCHIGANAKGGLKLDRLATSLQGGKNDGPALVPGDPSKSALLARVKSKDESTQMPPKGDRLTDEHIRVLETWIREGAIWPDLDPRQSTVTPLANDLVFLRRVYLDVLGIVPSLNEISRFEADRTPNKRQKLIDTVLADPRAADHAVGYWLDVLAENPNILNPTLNNTGPFRWWLYETFRDNKPADLWVTELIRQRGSERFGGPAGFRVASQNDAPLAQKGTIISSAFLGVEMKCARCHDTPANKSTQRELFQIAAMLGNAPQKVLATSSVPQDKLHEGGRKPLIRVTLAPGTEVTPKWSFPEYAGEPLADQLAEDP
jgi:mono/diheme cytochrome c family protein